MLLAMTQRLPARLILSLLLLLQLVSTTALGLNVGDAAPRATAAGPAHCAMYGAGLSTAPSHDSGPSCCRQMQDCHCLQTPAFAVPALQLAHVTQDVVRAVVPRAPPVRQPVDELFRPPI